MAAHPETLEKLGKGLAYVALAVMGYKSLKWLGDVTGVSKLVGWLWKLSGASDAVTGSFKKKNKSLDTQTQKTHLEWLKVLSLAGAFGLLLDGVRKVKDWLDKNPLKFPDFKFPDFNPAPIPVPIINPQLVPNWVMPIIPIISTLLLPMIIPQMDFSVITNKTNELSTNLQTSFEVIRITVSNKVEELSDNLKTTFDTIKTNVTMKTNELATNLSNSWETSKINISTKVGEILTNTQTSFETLKVNVLTKTTELSTGVATAFDNIKSNIGTFTETTRVSIENWSTNVATNVSTSMSSVATSVFDGLNNAGNNMNTWINNTSSNFATWGVNVVATFAETATSFSKSFAQGLSNSWDNFTEFCKATGTAISGWWSNNWQPVTAALAVTGIVAGAIALAPYTGGLSLGALAFANGGFPDEGQMFIAREAGPELVGSIGGRTAVANNDQIVQSVSSGVYQAVVSAMGNKNSSGGDFEVKVYLDGKQITANVEKHQRERGATIYKGGNAYAL